MPSRTVAPPVPGTINQTVAARPVRTLPAAALTATAVYGGGVTGQITRVVAVRASAQGPGEVAGPAVSITVRIDNHSGQAVAVGNAVLNVSDAQHTPGVLVTSSSQPLAGTLAPGAHAVGTYVFTLPTGHRDPVSVTVSYSPDAPVALFVGAVAS